MAELGRRRFRGKPFAIAFVACLVLATGLLTYLSRSAEGDRRIARERLEREGLLPRSE